MIFVIETVIMSAFHLVFLIDNIWLEVFTDAAMLVLFLIPSLYYFMLLPIEREIVARQQTEKALQEANDQAELRVKLRTAELEVTNTKLETEITDHQQAELELQNTNEKLNASVIELELRSREDKLLSEMSELLQACTSIEEAYRVIDHIGPRLFPASAGALYMYSPSRNDLEPVLMWGNLPQEKFTRIFEPDKCWALRRGRLHVIDSLCKGLACHISSNVQAGLCVPMITQGETLGVLYLRGQEADTPLPFNQQLAVTACEQIALALGNLRLRETLRSQSILDPLTGLYNRRFMEETLAREIRRAERNQRSLNLIMLDIDHFKEFNDTFGHEAGDAVLRELGQMLKDNTRGSDVSCRFGGEEFVLILPETTAEDARQRAEELREKSRRLTVILRGQSLGIITISLGLAAYPNHATTGEALLHAADKALYRAKAEGRDRVVIAEGS
ncbi:MAG: diguanylate cyclase [Anaerolineaceae bacterium]|nr:MAG: diguanylate cyclase [Anaerolineaceae bacterium]